MSIDYEHSVDVASDPATTFAFLDDVSQTPRWLARCTGIEKLSEGPNAVGTQLRYSYRDAGRSGTMTGEITARAPSERLTYRYTDGRMDVIVDFLVAQGTSGTLLTHRIEITPKTLLGKVVSPLIRRALPTQTVSAMTKLQQLLQA